MGQRAGRESPAPGAQMGDSARPPVRAVAPTPTPPECDSSLPCTRFFLLSWWRSHRTSFPPLSTGELLFFLGQELEWLHPPWATRNLAQAPLSLQEPGIPSTLVTPQRESICSGFYTCLQPLNVWLQSRDEVTRLSLWAGQGLFVSVPRML